MQIMHALPLDKRKRLTELLLVVAVAFLGSIAVSLYVLVTGTTFDTGSQPGTGSSSVWGAGIIKGIGQQVSVLALLAYVLSQQGRTLRDIGFYWRTRDIGWSVVVFLVAGLLCSLCSGLLISAGKALLGHRIDTNAINIGFLAATRFGTGFIPMLIYSILNPFVEELIVRAYVMSEVIALFNKTGLAIVVSVVVQISYHFYQGFWAAISYIPLFLVFAVYYARTRRILPVILAHLYFDVGAFFFHS